MRRHSLPELYDRNRMNFFCDHIIKFILLTFYLNKFVLFLPFLCNESLCDLILHVVITNLKNYKVISLPCFEVSSYPRHKRTEL